MSALEISCNIDKVIRQLERDIVRDTKLREQFRQEIVQQTADIMREEAGVYSRMSSESVRIKPTPDGAVVSVSIFPCHLPQFLTSLTNIIHRVVGQIDNKLREVTKWQ